MIVYSLDQYKELGDELIKKTNAIRGVFEKKKFPDGEIYHRIIEPIEKIKGMDVVILGSTRKDADLLEIYDLATQLVAMGAKRLHIWIPIYGYQTMERAVKSGEVVKAKTRAKILSSIPKAPLGNYFYALDLHSEGIPYYFENGSILQHVYSKPLVIDFIKSLNSSKMVLASTDAGRAKWVESLAKDLNVEAGFVFKQRTSDSTTKISGINANVKGKDVIIFDDMIRSGSSMIKAIEAYESNGARSIKIWTTHSLFLDMNIDVSKLIKDLKYPLFTTNSIGSFNSNITTFSIVDLIINSLKSNI